MTQRKILIITSEFPPQPGGIGNHAYNLGKQLLKADYAVRVIADQRSENGDAESHFDKSLKYPVHRIHLQKYRILMYLHRLIVLFKQIKESEVVMASGKFSLWSVAFASLFYKRSYVAVIHGTEVNFKQSLLKYSIDKAISRFSKIIAVSQFTKSLVAIKYHNKITVIPNGYAAQRWGKALPTNVDVKGTPKLITVGHVYERKGQGHVIKHLPELIQVYPDIHYHCVGIPTEQQSMLNLAKDLGVQEHVSFHGQVADSDLEALLCSSDIFVMLSGTTQTGDVEGFGIAIIEANALGVPAIGAEGSGVAEAIADYKSGILIPHYDSEAFLKAIQHILDDKYRFEVQAKKWSERHTWEVIIKRYITVLEL